MASEVRGKSEGIANLVEQVLNLHAQTLGHRPVFDIREGTVAPALPPRDVRKWLSLQAISDMESLESCLFREGDQYSVLKRHMEALGNYLEGRVEEFVTLPEHVAHLHPRQ